MLMGTEGDRVLLQIKDASKAPVFTKPLRLDGKTVSRWGSIAHEAIIGKQSRDVVVTNTGRELRVRYPTLDEYVTLTPRLVTPVYPADANLMVSLLDLHVSPRRTAPQNDVPLEILEAGTGHGALTLHLARAIHAANDPPPTQRLHDLEPERSDASQVEEGNHSKTDMNMLQSKDGAHRTALASSSWRSQRRATIHTIDVSSKHSKHAQTIVDGFRQGMYSQNVEFHVGDVSNWIDEQLLLREGNILGSETAAFLSHVFLDLPASYRHIEKASSALRADGMLMVFNPSITQITACVEVIRTLRLPLVLDRALELGPNMTRGKDWDIRAVKPRALIKAENDKKEALVSGNSDASTKSVEDEESAEIQVETKTRDEEQAQTLAQEEIGWQMICRPTVGPVTGGGFLGVWRKMKQREI